MNPTAFSLCFAFLNLQATSNFKVRMGKISCDCDIGEVSDALASPGGPVPAGDRLELGQCLGTDSPSASRRGQHDRQLDFGHQASRTVREHISAVLSLSVCGTLVRQPKETDTVPSYNSSPVLPRILWSDKCKDLFNGLPAFELSFLSNLSENISSCLPGQKPAMIRLRQHFPNLPEGKNPTADSRDYRFPGPHSRPPEMGPQKGVALESAPFNKHLRWFLSSGPFGTPWPTR